MRFHMTRVGAYDAFAHIRLDGNELQMETAGYHTHPKQSCRLTTRTRQQLEATLSDFFIYLKNNHLLRQQKPSTGIDWSWHLELETTSGTQHCQLGPGDDDKHRMRLADLHTKLLALIP